jgi:hypothetical protein
VTPPDGREPNWDKWPQLKAALGFAFTIRGIPVERIQNDFSRKAAETQRDEEKGYERSPSLLIFPSTSLCVSAALREKYLNACVVFVRQKGE